MGDHGNLLVTKAISILFLEQHSTSYDNSLTSKREHLFYLVCDWSLGLNDWCLVNNFTATAKNNSQLVEEY